MCLLIYFNLFIWPNKHHLLGWGEVGSLPTSFGESFLDTETKERGPAGAHRQAGIGSTRGLTTVTTLPHSQAASAP